MCHMPMARTEAQRPRARGRGVRAPAGRQRRHRRRPARARRRVVHDVPPDHRREAGHAGQLHRRLRRERRRPLGQAARAGCAADLRTVRGRHGTDDDHALGDGVPAGGSAARPAVGAVRDLPHALHESARSERRGDRRAPRAGAVSRMAAQRVPRRTAQLPVVPHARGRRGDAGSPPCSASRAQGLARHGSSAATPSCCGC